MTATVMYSLVHSLHIFTAMPSSTQTSTLHGKMSIIFWAE